MWPPGIEPGMTGCMGERLAALTPVGSYQLQLSISPPWRHALFAALLTSLNPVVGLMHGQPARLSALLLFAPQFSMRHQVQRLFYDPFSMVTHHWTWFDLTMLIPYFSVMIILSFYGIHRYTMCYLYFKYKKNYNPNPPRHFKVLPRVTVQLPIFNEQFVIDRLIEAVCAMEYPREKLEIQVLDDFFF